MDRNVVSLFKGAPDILKSYAQEVGEPYVGLSVADAAGAPALAVGYPLAHLNHPELIGAFVRWMELSGPQGLFRLGQDGTEETIWRDPLIRRPRSMMVIVDDRPPAEWYFARTSPGFSFFSHQNFRPRQIKDMPAKAILEVTCLDYQKLLDYRRPAVCRISGAGPFGHGTYDRLWLPMAGPDGRICRFVTLALVLEPLRG